MEATIGVVEGAVVVDAVLRVRAFTDVGLRRKRNEDAVLVGGWVTQTHDGSLVTMEFEPTLPFVCAVADGMGGHAGGNVASRLALTVIAERSRQWRTVDDVAATVAYASDQVRGVGAERSFEGLGTTVAGLCVTSEAIIVFNVGDSRVYSLAGADPVQLSHDDAVLDSAGNPTNVITQSLGQRGPVQTHVTTLPLLPGTYLLCSDGVSGVLSDDDIRSAVTPRDLGACASNLIAATRDRGADDNFSFLIVSVPDMGSSDTEPVAAGVGWSQQTGSAPLPPRGGPSGSWPLPPQSPPPPPRPRGGRNAPSPAAPPGRPRSPMPPMSPPPAPSGRGLR